MKSADNHFLNFNLFSKLISTNKREKGVNTEDKDKKVLI